MSNQDNFFIVVSFSKNNRCILFYIKSFLYKSFTTCIHESFITCLHERFTTCLVGLVSAFFQSSIKYFNLFYAQFSTCLRVQFSITLNGWFKTDQGMTERKVTRICYIIKHMMTWNFSHGLARIIKFKIFRTLRQETRYRYVGLQCLLFFNETPYNRDMAKPKLKEWRVHMRYKSGYWRSSRL